MEQLPRIVRNRLEVDRARQHPDADLLTSFREHALSDRERADLLEHVAQCSECRQLVSLAAELEPVRPAAGVLLSLLREKAGWLGSPRPSWRALAACVVVASAVGVLFYKHQAQRRAPLQIAMSEGATAISDVTTKAKSEAAQPRNEPSVPWSQIAESKPTTPASALRSAQGRPKVVGRSPSGALADRAHKSNPPPAANSYNVGVMGRSFAAIVARKDEQPGIGAARPALAPPKPLPPNSKAANQADKSVPSQTVEVDAQATLPPDQPDTHETMRTRGELARSQIATAPLTETTASLRAATTMRDWVTPQWTLSDDGLPQRSFDSGKTWQKVQVDHTTGFRALSAHGMDVWVGGVGGVLYHSSDVGLHWIRVTPVASGDTLATDIMCIEFSDPLQGTITTSAHQIWSTSDAGKTWQKR